MTRAFTNNALSTLTVGISSTATTIGIAAGSGSLFPSTSGGKTFYATITDVLTGTLREIVLCTSRMSDTLTVTRAQQSTSGRSYLAGDRFELLMTADMPNSAAYIDQTNTFTLPQIMPSGTDYADAGGTVDAITGSYPYQASTLVDGFSLRIGTIGLNTLTNPTFAPTLSGIVQTAQTIFKWVSGVAVALAPGDIQGVSSLVYDFPNTRWILMNPAQQQSTSAIVGSFRNLTASATGISTSVLAAADEIIVESATNTYQTLRAVSLTINSATSGVNGLDAGSIAASTWYAIWVIWNGSTTAGLLSLSATAPTLPAGYTHKARIGWIRTDGTANKYPLSFIQYGRRVKYKVAAGSNVAALPTLASGAAGSVTVPTWVTIGVAAFVPSTASSIGVMLPSPTAVTQTAVAPNTSYGAYNSATNPPPISVGATTSWQGVFNYDMLLENSNIQWASGGSVTLFCNGWEDNL